MNKELLKQCIIDNYQGVKEVDNGHGRGHWDKEDFTKDELSIIADEIIKDYENKLNVVSVSDDDIKNVAVDKASNGKYTWNFEYGVDMAKWMRDKLLKY